MSQLVFLSLLLDSTLSVLSWIGVVFNVRGRLEKKVAPPELTITQNSSGFAKKQYTVARSSHVRVQVFVGRITIGDQATTIRSVGVVAWNRETNIVGGISLCLLPQCDRTDFAK